MMYCEKKHHYVDQEMTCIKKCCIFYKVEEDSCEYPIWLPGLKKGKESNEFDI